MLTSTIFKYFKEYAELNVIAPISGLSSHVFDHLHSFAGRALNFLFQK